MRSRTLCGFSVALYFVVLMYMCCTPQEGGMKVVGRSRLATAALEHTCSVDETVSNAEVVCTVSDVDGVWYPAAGCNEVCTVWTRSVTNLSRIHGP
jgi:hypothetical protein